MSEKLTQEASTSSKSKGRWQPLLNLCQVVQLRGKLWNKYGISVNGSNFLYPEEVLFLFDSHKIEVENPSNPAAFWTKQELYNKALQIIPLSVYLVYMKLKVSFQCFDVNQQYDIFFIAEFGIHRCST